MSVKNIQKIYLEDQITLSVYYEDTDFSGFVFHANYLKFFERARSHMIGLATLEALFRQGFHFVVASAELKFKSPARFGDELIIKSSAYFSKSPRLCFNQNITNIHGEILVEAIIDLAFLDNKNRVSRIPERLLNYIKNRPS